MAGIEKWIAPGKKNTIALPEYSVELIYLGDDGIPVGTGAGDPYRCRFELVEEGGDPPTAVAKDARIPLAKENKAYRVMIHDNHAATSTETSSGGGDVLGAGADSLAKPTCYANNNWVRDVRPAVAFRVKIVKRAAGVQVTVSPNEVFVTWKIKDPKEDLDRVDVCRSPDRPKQFLKEFFTKFNRKTDDKGWTDDDNCSDQFAGLRQRDGSIDACKALFSGPFTPPGAALERQPDPPGLSSSDPHHEKLARSLVTPEGDIGADPIGVSNVVFYPPAISGDNYVFSIGLAGPSGNPISFKDYEGNTVKEYETGKFTLWRKVTIDMLVTFDSVDESYINWDDAKNAYGAAFMDVVKPVTTVKFAEAAWKAKVRKYLKDTQGVGDADLNAAVWDFNKFFLPKLSENVLKAMWAALDPANNLPANYGPGDADDLYWTWGADCAKLFLDKAYADKGKTSPRADAAQNTSLGLYVFLCKKLQAVSGALGQYMDEREFFMVTVGDATCTFVHEMGHALYLRHALTSFGTIQNVGGVNTLVAPFVTRDVAHTRGAWLDHDQDDAIVCVMSYQNDYYDKTGKSPLASGAVEWHFCAICLLKLRFWDTVLLRGNRWVRAMVYSKMAPFKLTDGGHAPLGSFTIPKGVAGQVRCVAKAEATSNNLGQKFEKDVTGMTNAKWISSRTSAAAFTGPGRLQAGATAGKSTTIHFETPLGEKKSNSATGRVT